MTIKTRIRRATEDARIAGNAAERAQLTAELASARERIALEWEATVQRQIDCEILLSDLAVRTGV